MSIAAIPEPILRTIALELSTKDQTSMSRVCRLFANVVAPVVHGAALSNCFLTFKVDLQHCTADHIRQFLMSQWPSIDALDPYWRMNLQMRSNLVTHLVSLKNPSLLHFMETVIPDSKETILSKRSGLRST